MFSLNRWLSAGVLLSGYVATTILAQEWEAVPLRTVNAAPAGPGGEGCQWPIALAADPKEGTFLLFGTDVGGVYRSLDGGGRWEPANIGFNARGATGFAIDPNAPRRALAIGSNSVPRPEHGLYLTEDRGSTWRHVFSYSNLGYRDVREQVVFDPDSAGDTGISQIAYWSAESVEGRPARIHRSLDGGRSWTELEASNELGPCTLRVQSGTLFAGGPHGLYRSDDQGGSFRRILEEPVHGLDVVPAERGVLYVATPTKILRSPDAGASFQPLAAPPNPPAELRAGLLYLKVSPADPRRMAVNRDEGEYNCVRYFSHDGGRTWGSATFCL